MAITELVTGGFGDLGQAAGAGLNEYTTQMDYDKLAQYVDSLFKQGVSPQQAVQLVNQRFPGVSQGGGQPGQAPAPQAPRPQVPGLNQGNVVMDAVPMQGANPLGSLGAPQQAPQQVPQQSAPAPMGVQSARGPVDDTMLQTSPGRSPPQMQLMQENPPQPESYAQPRPQNRMQQTNAAPSQAPQQGAQGMAGLITPRNMPLAQMLLQQQTSRVNAQAAGNAKTQVAGTNLERDRIKQEGRMEVERFKADARAGIVSAQLQARLQQFDAQNQTDIWQSLLDYNAKRAAIAQSGLNAATRNNVLLELYKSNNNLLGRIGVMRGMDPELDAQIDKAQADQDALKLVVGGVQNVPGPDVKVPGSPGVNVPVIGNVGGTPDTTKPGKPSSVIKGPAAPAPAPAPPKGGSERVSIIVVATGRPGSIPRSQLDQAIKAGVVRLP